MIRADRRFVVQRHTTGSGQVHYDLMIEDPDAQVLVTFQLEAAPGPAGVAGRRSFDHRLRYLDYEGRISGGRGEVAIWDAGRLEDVRGSPREDCYQARFSGDQLAGLFEVRVTGEAVVVEPL